LSFEGARSWSQLIQPLLSTKNDERIEEGGDRKPPFTTTLQTDIRAGEGWNAKQLEGSRMKSSLPALKYSEKKIGKKGARYYL